MDRGLEHYSYCYLEHEVRHLSHWPTTHLNYSVLKRLKKRTDFDCWPNNKHIKRYVSVFYKKYNDTTMNSEHFNNISRLKYK